MANRTLIKWEMQLDRGGQYALCDLGCGELAYEMHEIINRARTRSNPAAREASYNKHICSLLCPECHTINHKAEGSESYLLAINFGLYGREAVLAAIKVVQDLLYLPLDLDIPEVGQYEPR